MESGHAAAQTELRMRLHSAGLRARCCMRGWQQAGLTRHDKQRAPCSGISTMTLYDTAAGGAAGPSGPASK